MAGVARGDRGRPGGRGRIESQRRRAGGRVSQAGAPGGTARTRLERWLRGTLEFCGVCARRRTLEVMSKSWLRALDSSRVWHAKIATTVLTVASPSSHDTSRILRASVPGAATREPVLARRAGERRRDVSRPRGALPVTAVTRLRTGSEFVRIRMIHQLVHIQVGHTAGSIRRIPTSKLSQSTA